MSTVSTDYFEKALEYVQKKGFKNIKSKYDEFEDTTSFSQDGEKTVAPDITATKGGGKSYFQISLKNDDETGTVSKWKLFATLAEMKGGKLFLLAPRGHKSFTVNIVKTYDLNATVISI